MLEHFREVNNTFPHTQQIEGLKNSGGKVFGWLCTYVPEEIIHAAGILPVRIVGYTHETELEDGNAYLYINNCSFSRSCLQMGIRGEYDFLDGVVGGSTCDGARRLFDLWRHYINTPFYHVLTVPRKFSERAHQLYLHEVREFKKHLEEFTEKQIDDASLLGSIELYNEFRSLMKELYDMRKLDSPPISGAETLEVLNASFRMPKEEYNPLVREFIDTVKTSGISRRPRARLMLIGSVMTNPEFVSSIEDQGGMVVTDELCTSTRYWGDPVVLRDGQNPVESISRRYLDNFPCARMFPAEERFRRILDYCREFRVDGVISQIVRYCVPYSHDLPLLTERLKEEGIPVLGLDVEYGTSGSGQIATRVQAFMEMLEARRK